MIFMRCSRTMPLVVWMRPDSCRNGASMVAMNEIALPDALYPPIEPFGTGWLEVGDGHRLYYEQCGSTQGLPVVFLHGGPWQRLLAAAAPVVRSAALPLDLV